MKGSSAHASTPWQGTNALFELARAVQRIEQYEPERDTSTSLFSYLSTFAIEDKPSPENIDQIIAGIEPSNPRFASIMRALSRMTVTPTMIQGRDQVQQRPRGDQADLRRSNPAPPERGVRAWPNWTEFCRARRDWTTRIDYMAVPNSSPFETDFAQRIQSVTARALDRGDIQWVPAISTGFTDSRFIRPLGTITYGFSGAHPDDDPMLTRNHGTDESIGIKSLVSGTKIMLALACDLLGAE